MAMKKTEPATIDAGDSKLSSGTNLHPANTNYGSDGSDEKHGNTATETGIDTESYTNIDPDPDAEPAILINLSDTFSLPRQGSSGSESSRVSNQRQSMGWYGAFMAGGGGSGSE